MSSLPDWCRPHAGGCLLILHVQPNAKTTAAAGTHGDALKVRLAAPPVDGRANAALIDWLSRVCEVRKQDVELKSGASGRRKSFVIHGATDAARLISQLCGQC